MACCIEKVVFLPPLFGKCIYKVSNIQYYYNQKKHELFLQKNHRSYYNRNITFRRLLER